MKTAPFYEDDHVRLYCGDSISLLPSILDALETPLGAVVMDPSYSSGTRKEAAKSGDRQKNRMLRGDRFASKPIANDQMTTVGFVWLMRETMLQIAPHLIEGGHVASFIDWRNWPNLLGALESCNLRVNNMVVWDKLSMGLGNGFRNRHELIIHASNGPCRPASRSIPNVLRHPRDTTTDHPSPKPVSLMADVLSVTLHPGDVVIDPFAGAGATLVAAKAMGHKAIGIDLDESHCETAAARLAEVDAGSWEWDTSPEYTIDDFLSAAED